MSFVRDFIVAHAVFGRTSCCSAAIKKRGILPRRALLIRASDPRERREAGGSEHFLHSFRAELPFFPEALHVLVLCPPIILEN